MKNIYWRDIPAKAKIKLKGAIYTYQGKVVYWNGEEAREAQGALNAMAGIKPTSEMTDVEFDAYLKKNKITGMAAFSAATKRRMVMKRK